LACNFSSVSNVSGRRTEIAVDDGSFHIDGLEFKLRFIEHVATRRISAFIVMCGAG
jgi:hypothetical protein